MSNARYITKLCSTALIGCFIASSAAVAAETEIQMLNKGADNSMFVFEPDLVKIAPGDSVHFVATTKGHNVEAIKTLIPDGAEPFAGKNNEDLTVKFDKPGIYGYECKPHYGMGMVGFIVVGKPTNEDAIKTTLSGSSIPNFAKIKLTKILAKIDAGK